MPGVVAAAVGAILAAVLVVALPGATASAQGSVGIEAPEDTEGGDLSAARDALASIQTRLNENMERLQAAHGRFMSGEDADNVDEIDQTLNEIQENAETILQQVRAHGPLGDLIQKTRTKAQAQIDKISMMGLTPEEEQMLLDHWTKTLEQFEAAVTSLDGSRDKANQSIRDLETKRPLLREMYRIRNLAEIKKIIGDITGNITELSGAMDTVLKATDDPLRNAVPN